MARSAKETEDFTKLSKILYLPCNELSVHPLRYSFYAESHIEELVRSMRVIGLLEPVLVCSADDGGYMILSGHYRVRAARRLRWKEVLCRLVECDRRRSYMIFCTSNILTRGLGAIEEAHMISLLVSREKLTYSEIGEIWGRSKSWVSRRIGLLTRLDPPVEKDLGTGYLSPRIAQELMRLPRGNHQSRVLKIIRKWSMSKDEAAALVTWWLEASEPDRIDSETKGPPWRKTPAQVTAGENLQETVSAYLEKCTGLLNKLISIVECSRFAGSWPDGSYISFRRTSEHLDNLLAELLTARKETQ